MAEGGKKNVGAQSLTSEPDSFAGFLRKYNAIGKGLLY